MTLDPAAAVTAANDRILAPIRARRAQYYTLASEALRAAGGVSALVAYTACPADARERMVEAARAFFVAHRNDRDVHRANEGLAEAMQAWNLTAEAMLLAKRIGYALPPAE